MPETCGPLSSSGSLLPRSAAAVPPNMTRQPAKVANATKSFVTFPPFSPFTLSAGPVRRRDAATIRPRERERKCEYAGVDFSGCETVLLGACQADRDLGPEREALGEDRGGCVRLAPGDEVEADGALTVCVGARRGADRRVGETTSCEVGDRGRQLALVRGEVLLRSRRRGEEVDTRLDHERAPRLRRPASLEARYPPVDAAEPLRIGAR